MGTDVVPNDNHLTPQVPERVPEKLKDLVLADVLFVQLKYMPRRRLLGLTDRPEITEMRRWA